MEETHGPDCAPDRPREAYPLARPGWRGGYCPAVTALHVFDMDGTLLGSSASMEVARQLGTLAEVTGLEARLAAGEIGTRDFARVIVESWRQLTEEMVAAAFEAGPWLAGIAEVCADIRARGELSAVITMSPDFFARHLLGQGFDHVVASAFPPLPLTGPLALDGILRPADKITIVGELCARHGLTLDSCVAYGDSMSDAPVFGCLARTVAVNADHHLEGLAAEHYRGQDLMAAYRLGRGLLRS
jgi:phosphoserine phosphatase